MNPASTTGALRRVIRRPEGAGAAVERCDLCGVPMPERHRHVLDEHSGELLCTCQACKLLFEREAAGRGHYRLIPDKRTRLPEIAPGDLGIPVSLAFVLRHADGAVVAHYPNPLGETRWEVDTEVWQAACERVPPLRDLLPAVQALLVHTGRGRREHWIVPVDDCYRLVALIRREWTGLSGGPTVWPAVDEFFAGLAGRGGNRPAEGSDHG